MRRFGESLQESETKSLRGVLKVGNMTEDRFELGDAFGMIWVFLPEQERSARLARSTQPSPKS